jgi:hypothetical protein
MSGVESSLWLPRPAAALFKRSLLRLIEIQVVHPFG